MIVWMISNLSVLPKTTEVMNFIDVNLQLRDRSLRGRQQISDMTYFTVEALLSQNSIQVDD